MPRPDQEIVMIRKTRSRTLVALTTATVVSLAALFACVRNSAPQPVPTTQPTENTPLSQPSGDAAATAKKSSDVGKLAYERLRCSLCHSIDGKGNKNSPLDGVGSKHDKAALRDWTIGAGAAKDALPDGIARLKSGFGTAQDLDALVDYLTTLR